MKTLNTLNIGLNKIDSILDTQKVNKAVGIKNAILEIDTRLKEIEVLGMTSRKSRKLVKTQVMESLEGETNKSILRAYSIAFTMEFRGLEIDVDLLTVAQIENLANHGETKAVNELMDSEQYEQDVKEYLRSIKTRLVTVKAFEKKS